MTLLMGFFIVLSLLHESGASMCETKWRYLACHSLGGRAPRITRVVIVTPSLVMGTFIDADQECSWPWNLCWGCCPFIRRASRTSKTLRLRAVPGGNCMLSIFMIFFVRVELNRNSISSVRRFNAKCERTIRES
jgi:hypothetical protein